MSDANRITADLLDEIPRRFAGVRVWRSNRVKALALGSGGKKRMISAGVNGQADISGIIGQSGTRLEIEVKAGRDSLNADQRRFGAMILNLGGVYIVARDVETTLADLKDCIEGKQ